MIIGIPQEIKDKEYRVALTPGGAELLKNHGHTLLIQKDAGLGSGFVDNDYIKAGALLIDNASNVWEKSDMVMKVKEPLSSEYLYFREGLVLFTYLHLAAEKKLTLELINRKVTSIGYETVELQTGELSLLIPMSEVAGRMSIQKAAHYLEKMNGGRGKLLGGVPGVRPSEVVILGGGTVGINAAFMALGMGAHVTIIEKDLNRLRYLSEVLHGNLTSLSSNPLNISESVAFADIVIGAVLVHGGLAPKLITKEMISRMKPGSVVIDVSIDQGGCIETSKPTTHSEPTYLENDVIHYMVTNMPGAVPRTSTYALTNATLPYALEIASMGFEESVKRHNALALGTNTYKGNVTYKAVAQDLKLPYAQLEDLL